MHQMSLSIVDLKVNHLQYGWYVSLGFDR